MSKIGIIYKILSTDINIKEIYVGSTINFRTRKCHHKKACNSDNNRKHNLNVYKYIRANGGWDTFDMIQIEEVKHDNKQQLHARERYWIEELKATLNKRIPTRTLAEYYEDNKEAIKVKRAEYLIDNKDYFKKNKAKHYQENKEAIKIRVTKYKNENKEDIKVKRAEYYQKSKDSKTIICNCGSKFHSYAKLKHEKTIKHKNWLLTQ